MKAVIADANDDHPTLEPNEWRTISGFQTERKKQVGEVTMWSYKNDIYMICCVSVFKTFVVGVDSIPFRRLR